MIDLSKLDRISNMASRYNSRALASLPNYSKVLNSNLMAIQKVSSSMESMLNAIDPSWVKIIKNQYPTNQQFQALSSISKAILPYTSTISSLSGIIASQNFDPIYRVFSQLNYQDSLQIAEEIISEINSEDEVEVPTQKEIQESSEEFLKEISEPEKDISNRELLAEIKKIDKKSFKVNLLFFLLGLILPNLFTQSCIDLSTPFRMKPTISMTSIPLNHRSEIESILYLEGMYYCKVRPNTLSVHLTASGKSNVVDYLYMSDIVLVVQKGNKYWRKVRLNTEGGTIEGWVKSKYLVRIVRD